MNETRQARHGERARSARSLRAAGWSAALIALVALVCSDAPSAGDPADELGDTRAALEKWRETRRLIAKEKHDWAVAKELLQDRIELVQTEIERLRGRLEETRGSVTEADTKRSELIAEADGLDAASATLQDTVVGFEQRTRALLERLPETLRERVKPLSQRLPKDSGETKASLSERFQNVVGILNAVNKFHREITPTSEVRTLADGTRAEVTVMYVGVSWAFYATTDGRSAGFGRPGPDGWTWTAADESAAEIAAAIDILDGGQEARFVQVPVELE